MGDNVEFPVAPSTALVATDEVDLRDDAVMVQVPFGKIIDGADGGTDRLRVRDGSLLSSSRSVGTISGFSPITTTGYAAGDVYGVPADLDDIVNGLYRVHKVVVADAGQNPLPSDMVMFLLPHDAAHSLAGYGGDGDPFTPNDTVGFYSNVVELTPLAASATQLGVYQPAGEVLLIGTPIDGSGTPSGADVFTLTVMYVVPSGTTDPVTPVGLVSQLFLERVGPSIHETVLVTP